MNCEIITIGSELLHGQIIDTNASYIARTLNSIGFTIAFHTTVGDIYTQIKDVVFQAWKRADLIITTGGIGPTEDDLTREAIADMAGVSLIFKKELMDQIEAIFKSIGYSMPENNRKQAYVPDGATPILNEVGTAPGFIIEKESKLLISLPGVPKELKYLLNKKVVPYLKKYFQLDQEIILSKTLKVTGIGESKVDIQIKDLIKATSNPTIGILASPGDISIIITTWANSKKEANALIKPIERKIRSRLGNAVYGINNDTLHGVVTNLLNKRGDTVSIFETFSGGELTKMLQRSPLSPLHKSIVIGRKGHIPSFLDTNGPPLEMDKKAAESLANKIKHDGNSSIGLALVGTVKESEKGYNVEGHVVVSGENVKGFYDWKMGGDMPTLQNRSAIIALNTLRLALIS
ncbi:MAG: CinA family nicotinamide mononucleotide deamidase-related protein [Desulfatiglandales bacterium]